MKFAVFYPKPGFQWTLNRIFYTALLVIIALFLFEQFILEKESVIIWFFFLWALIGFIVKIWSYFEVRPLHGVLSGFLEFRKDAIVIDDEIYPVIDIKGIEIAVSDYYGTEGSFDRYDFNQRLSNGTNSTLKLLLLNNDFIEVRFEIVNRSDFTNLKGFFIGYHILGLLKLNDLRLLFGDGDKSLQAEVKKMKEMHDNSNKI